MRGQVSANPEGVDLGFWHRLIESRGRHRLLKKGEHLCRKGERTSLFGYVKSGYLIYRIDGGAGPGRIGGFVFAEALWGCDPGCMENKPAMYDIVAGRKTEVWEMDASCLPGLFGEDAEACRHERIFMEALYGVLAESYCSIYSSDAVERYKALIKRHPAIEQAVSQKEIAEYLQIYPASLSRIKRRLLGRGDR